MRTTREINTFELIIYSNENLNAWGNFYILHSNKFFQMFCKNVAERWPRSSYIHDVNFYNECTYIAIHGIYRNVSVGVSVRWNSKSEAAMYSCHINQSFDRADNSQPSRFLFSKASHIFRISSNRIIFFLTRRESTEWNPRRVAYRIARRRRECVWMPRVAKQGQGQPVSFTTFLRRTSYIGETNSRLVVPRVCPEDAFFSHRDGEKSVSIKCATSSYLILPRRSLHPRQLIASRVLLK